VAAATGFDGEAVGPLAFDCVQYVFLFAGGIQCGGEAVLLARDPAFTGIIDLGYVSGRGGDEGAVVELDEWFTVYETFDVEGG